MKGQKTGGRSKGTLNKATREARSFCASVVDDVVYQNRLRRRALAGTLSPALECMLWHYAKGKPTDTVKILDISKLSTETLQRIFDETEDAN
jgi:hypothetical protein